MGYDGPLKFADKFFIFNQGTYNKVIKNLQVNKMNSQKSQYHKACCLLKGVTANH